MVEEDRGFRGYLGPEGDPRNPLISPLFADLHDLPPALILTCEYDPLRDGGEQYGQKLRETGVPAAVHRNAGMLHGTFVFGKLVPEVTAEYYGEIGDFLNGVFRGQPAQTVDASMK